MELGNDTVLHGAMTATVRENGTVVLLDPVPSAVCPSNAQLTATSSFVRIRDGSGKS